jgi:hypothetical protein
MSKDTLTFILEGSAARNGNIPADVFVAKMKQFVSTMYSFDRAFAGRAKRGVDLEVVDLKKINPALVYFNSRALVRGYDAPASVAWTIDQFQKIASKDVTDPRVSQDALDNVIDLATVRKAKIPALVALRVEYNKNEVVLDEAIIGNAMSLRHSRRLEVKEIWKPGVSKGSIFGELKGVTDISGEKTFWILAPNGRSTQCVFPEQMRQSVQDNLWNTVRVTGFMRYDGLQPKPYLIDAEKIERITPSDGQPHLLDLRGAFKGYDDVDQEELV